MRGRFTEPKKSGPQPQKVNYQKKLDAVLAGLTDTAAENQKPSLLLHSCCGPCSSYVLEYLEPYFAITVYYYDPCIFPEEEYAHRKAVQAGLIEAMNKKGSRIAMAEAPYVHGDYLETVRGHEQDPEGGERCHLCYEERLRATGLYAKAHGFDWFCTTLSVSPYKDAQALNAMGLKLQQELGVSYLCSDFKKRSGYLRSIELSKEYGLYRQDYCGCEFSFRTGETHTDEKE